MLSRLDLTALNRTAADPSSRALDAGWRLCERPAGAPQPHAAEGDWIDIDAPTTVADALRRAGRWSLDAEPRRFDASDWWYRCSFDGMSCAAGERIVIRFGGLATIAEIHLNGELLGRSDNMFTAVEFDLTGSLRAQGNELMLRFASLDAALVQRRPRPRWRVPMLVQQQLRWWRTTLLGRTPGWSPPVPAIGPWRDIRLERRALLDDVEWSLETSLASGAGIVRCRVRSPRAGLPPVALQVNGHGFAGEVTLRETGEPGVLAGELRIAGVRAWWPHTHGEAALYEASLVQAGAIRRLGRVGFRSVELDTAADGFRLRINGQAVFCRGACWMPMDIASLRSDPAACREAVAQARSAGMNMLRVPGTTVYEEDHFYRACDELGVLVWQDFMFANMDYPAQDAGFAASVATEVRQQLGRLHAHPCLAVLCGNSEVEQQAAMWGAPRESWSSPLFDETIAGMCAGLAPNTPYWPSSAHGGALPFQADAGTTSYYGVGAYLRPLEDARRSGLKFASECLAFANVPSPATIERIGTDVTVQPHHAAWKARSPRDLGAGWDFDDVRDHYLHLLFGADPAKLRYADPARYLALSRVVTGEVMAAAFSEWRRPDSGCGGALVLSLRDLWAGAGWGLVDERGVPKACFQALQRVLQPRAVLLTDEGGNGLAIHLINERETALEARIELAAWQSGEVVVAEGARELVLAGRSARTLPAQELLDAFMDLGYAYRFGPPPCDMIRVRMVVQGECLSQAFHFPAGMPALFPVEPGLDASLVLVDETSVELTVSAQRAAVGVHFDIEGWQATEEHFHMAPGEQRVVLLRRTGKAAPRGEVLALNGRARCPVRVVTSR